MTSEEVRGEVALIPEEEELAVIEAEPEDDELAVIEEGEELALIPEDQENLENQGDQVESVLNRRLVDGRTQYLVKWLGYETTENSWEPEENLYNCQEEIKAFHERRKLIINESKTEQRNHEIIRKSYNGEKKNGNHERKQINSEQRKTEERKIRFQDGRNGEVQDFWLSLAALAELEAFQDVVLICEDEMMPGVRLLLALAFPFMSDVLMGRDDEEELTVILPEYKAQEVKSRIQDFLNEGGKNKIENKKEELPPVVVEMKNDEENDKDSDVSVIDCYDIDSSDSEEQNSSSTTLVKDLSSEDNESEKLVCEQCDLLFKTVIELMEHKLDVHNYNQPEYGAAGPVTERFKCPHCEDLFAFQSSLQKHIAASHQNEDVTCPYCFQVLERSALKMHTAYWHPEVIQQQRNQAKKEQVLGIHNLSKICNKCGLRCRSLSQLKHHKKGVHGEMGGSRVQCEHCEKTFYNKPTLNRHLTSGACLGADSQKHNYFCDICQRGFITKRTMIKHRKNHDRKFDDKPFHCPYCGSGFTERFNMHAHQRRGMCKGLKKMNISPLVISETLSFSNEEPLMVKPPSSPDLPSWSPEEALKQLQEQEGPSETKLCIRVVCKNIHDLGHAVMWCHDEDEEEENCKCWCHVSDCATPCVTCYCDKCIQKK